MHNYTDPVVNTKVVTFVGTSCSPETLTIVLAYFEPLAVSQVAPNYAYIWNKCFSFLFFIKKKV